MITFYYNPISPNARRVWLTLLEKGIPFQPVIMKLDGDQFQPEFQEINPFHHIPVLVDNGFRVVESLAIMDYLESTYPDPSLLPTNSKDLATVRMVQLLTSNELFSEMVVLIYESEVSPLAAQARQKIAKVLDVFSELLGDRPYFGSDQLTLADIVAGTAVPLLPSLGVDLAPYALLDAWMQRVLDRPAWQTACLSPEQIDQFKRRVKVLVKLRRRQLSQGSQERKGDRVSVAQV
mgnify:CR=1 FL=1